MALDYGIKVSEPGYDVKTCADINLSLKSDLKLLKVFSYGSVNLVGDQTIEHNLGYVPQFLVYVYYATDGASMLATGHVSFALAKIDSANLYIKDWYSGYSATSAKYYIFYEQA